TGIGSPPPPPPAFLDVSRRGGIWLGAPPRRAPRRRPPPRAPPRAARPAPLGARGEVRPADLPVLIAQIQAGALVPIGAASDKRDALLPDVPTLAEQGYPNTDASNWYALLAPAKTPPALIAKLNKALNDALDDPQVHDKMVKSGATPVG